MSEYTPPPGYNGGFAPLSSWGGNTAATNPAIADVYNRGWTTTGTSFNVPVLGPYQAPSFASYLGAGPAQAMGYADANAQLQDALGMSSRYATGWPWGNKAGRYSFANGAAQPPGGLLGGGGGQGAPGSATPPQTGGGLPAPGTNAPPAGTYSPPGDWTATGGPPNSSGVYPAAGPLPQGFGPYAAAPSGTAPPASLMPRPGGAQPQQQDGALAYLTRKYGPQRAQAMVNYMAAGPQQLSEWNALGNDTSRGQYLNTHPGFARELLNSGNMSSPQSTLYSLLALGSSGR